jgi:hypothetical protein
LDKAIIVRGTKEKKRIVDAYEECFGSEFDHTIVSKNKIKIEQDPDFDHSCMKPALSKWYWVSELLILNVITKGDQGAPSIALQLEETTPA